jgi:hypothetical protein
MWVQDAFFPGQIEHTHISPAHNPEWQPEDAYFFPAKSESSRERGQRRPLIVFPHERQELVADERKGLLQEYVTKVWARAGKVIKEADEITFIGYSFQGIDRGPILDLLRSRSCEHIRLKSPNAGEVAEELMFSNSDFEGAFKPVNLPF